MTTQTQYPSMDDARLAQQARADPEAFAELYRRHVRSIYRYHLADRESPLASAIQFPSTSNKETSDASNLSSRSLHLVGILIAGLKPLAQHVEALRANHPSLLEQTSTS